MRLGLGNHAADKVVKDYLKCGTEEKLHARFTCEQATPFLIDKFTLLAQRHFQRSMDNLRPETRRLLRQFALAVFDRLILARLKFMNLFGFQMRIGFGLIKYGIFGVRP